MKNDRNTEIVYLATACANEHVNQGAPGPEWDEQGVIPDGDMNALWDLLGREPTRDEEALFDKSFREAFEGHFQ